MTIQFLVNNYAAVEDAQYTGMGSVNGLLEATGYKKEFGIIGPRDLVVKMQVGASSFGYGFAYGTAQAKPDYLVICSAHKLLTSATMNVTGYSADATPTYAQFFTFPALAKSDLVGIRQQDLVVSIGALVSNHRHGVRFDSAGTESTMFSHLYVSSAFDLGTNPDVGGVNIVLEEDEFEPRFSSIRYYTEARIELTFSGVTQAKCEAFKALTNIYDWPFLIYDADGDVFPYNLEHVLLETYEEARVSSDNYVVRLQCKRLKHYD